jgi:hypothetical protein
MGANVRAVSRGTARVLQSSEIRHRVGAAETCRGKPRGLHNCSCSWCAIPAVAGFQLSIQFLTSSIPMVTSF